jgi:hypothetical protein
MSDVLDISELIAWLLNEPKFGRLPRVICEQIAQLATTHRSIGPLSMICEVPGGPHATFDASNGYVYLANGWPFSDIWCVGNIICRRSTSYQCVKQILHRGNYQYIIGEYYICIRTCQSNYTDIKEYDILTGHIVTAALNSRGDIYILLTNGTVHALQDNHSYKINIPRAVLMCVCRDLIYTYDKTDIIGYDIYRKIRYVFQPVKKIRQICTTALDEIAALDIWSAVHIFDRFGRCMRILNYSQMVPGFLAVFPSCTGAAKLKIQSREPHQQHQVTPAGEWRGPATEELIRAKPRAPHTIQQVAHYLPDYVYIDRIACDSSGIYTYTTGGLVHKF